MIRGVLRLLALLTVAGAAAVVAARVAGWEGGPLPIVVAFTPYAVLLAAVGIVLALLGRAPLVLTCGAVVAAVVVATQARWFVPDGAVAAGSGLTVLSVNLQYGAGDAGQVVAAVRRERVDVLAVQELTPEAVERLRGAGLETALPHSFVRPAGRAAGIGLWARRPLASARELPGFALGNVAAELEVGGRRLTVAAVHPVRPDPGGSAAWRREQAALRTELGRLRGDVVVAGDFNATRDHASMRRLGDDGFVDAADTTGAGLVRTWPARGGVPEVPGLPQWVSAPRLPGVPMIAIDHVLTRGEWRALRHATVPIDGSDHLGVLAELRPAA